MTLSMLVETMRSHSRFRSLAGSLPAAGDLTGVGGTPGSGAALLVASLAAEHPHRMFVVVVETPADAEQWLSDLEVLAGGVALYPQRETLEDQEPHFEIAGERVETLEALLGGRLNVLVTTARATLERTSMPAGIARNQLTITAGGDATFERVVSRLEAMGYERQPTVRDVAQFAVRGGIVDVYGFGMAEPARIEWWGDEVVSIRGFELDSQRSTGPLDAVTVLPVRVTGDPAPEGDAVRQSLLDLIPRDAVFVAPAGIGETLIRRIYEDQAHHIEAARERTENVPQREVLFLDPAEWQGQWNRFGRIVLGSSDPGHDLGLFEPMPIERSMDRLRQLARRQDVLVLCDNEGQLERLEELLANGGPATELPPGLILALGSLSGGFAFPDLMVLTDHEIFRRARRIRRARRYRQSLAVPGLDAFRQGDYVVHLEHGIGIYRGIQTIRAGGANVEVVVLEYEGGDLLNVPIYRLDQIEPYRGAGDGTGPPPRLDRLGGNRWRKQRERAQTAIRRLAAELIELYARRSVASGFAFPPDTRWQKELESAFLYEDTPDQRRSTEEVKRDLEKAAPMDRIVVGDVGYGKTEVAIRAAFKVAVAGKQVAMLVPTTVLAEQHGVTFTERLADFPVKVEVLSRFRTPAEQRAVLAGLADGTVDIVIGTHRLLSNDVIFKDLGLLIVDEEHRFGVKHKERLKTLKLSVDILTLTATPIPRTLNLALSGLRDMSLIETPPSDRSPVLTFVEPWDDGLLEEVIARELDRGGQVFFVHNRIQTIESVAEKVKRLAPRARVAVAHGRMRERDLDDVMRRFVSGEVDVLVSTMIVESGLDVANANTMIVHHAERLGLAQLYQLRGRVGRGHRRAYCYLLVPDQVDKEAEDRLKLLEHHTDLGSGYRLALRDLEIRGAGNLLGREQSGFAHQVGFDLYMRWLKEAVDTLNKGESARERQPPEVIFDGPAHLPDGYIPDEEAKLELYRRLARAEQLGDIGKLREELRDRFGRLPDEAARLLIVAELRMLGAELGMETIIVRGDDARLNFRTTAAPRLAGLTVALEDVQFRAEVRRMIPLSLRLCRLGGVSIEQGLVRAMAAALGEETSPAVAS